MLSVNGLGTKSRVDAQGLFASRGDYLELNANIHHNRLAANSFEKTAGLQCFNPLFSSNYPWWWTLDALVVSSSLTRNSYEYNFNNLAMELLSNDEVRERLNEARGFEPAVANICLQGRNFDTSPWVNNNTPTLSQNETGVDGVANKAWTITDNDVGSAEGVYQTFSISADTRKYTATIFVKKTTGASSFPCVGFYWVTSGTFAYVIIDTDSGSLINSALGGPDSKSISDNGTFWRVDFTDANPGTNTSVRLDIYAAVNNDGSSSFNVAQTGSAVFDMAQVVVQAFPASRCIDNDGVAVGSEEVTDGVFEAVTEGPELLANAGLETHIGTQDDGVSDSFSSWSTSGIDANNIADSTATVSSGSSALKLISSDGAGILRALQFPITVIPGKTYKFSVDTRGDGSVDGDYAIYDIDHSTYIVNFTNTGVVGTSYDTVTYYFTAPAGCTQVSINLALSSKIGTVYFDNVSLKNVTFTSWADTADGLAPGTSAGALTNKAQFTASTSNLDQTSVFTVGKVYRIAVTAVVTSGDFRFGDSTAPNYYTVSSSGTYYSYIIAADTRLRFDGVASFTGTIDDVSVVEHGSVGVSESAQLQYTLPSGLFDSQGTLIVNCQFGFNESDQTVTRAGIVAVRDSEYSLLHTRNNNTIDSADGSSEAAVTLAWVANTEYKFAVKWGYDSKFKVGFDNSGISWGSEIAFDGAYTTGANLILAHTPYGPIWIKYLMLFDRVLTDREINHINSLI